MTEIDFAEIEIKKSGDVFSPDFDDIYFSPAGGYMESLHVFAEPNLIPQRFFQKNETHIFEAGFGTGLNFLLTMKLFLQFAPKDSKLVFTSFEKFPIRVKDLEQIHDYFIFLRSESIEFLNEYFRLKFKKGINKISLKKNRVELNLIVDDLKFFEDYIKDEKFDAWYLDGFNPSSNPDMWTDKFFRFMYEKSFNKATFSTFSAAGFIKRSLESSGFKVFRDKGFNRKRNMLKGIKP